jgi:hypothetical protein
LLSSESVWVFSTIHFEIWTDQVGGCAGGYPFCPGVKIGGDSDPFTVDGLATMQSSPNGACGDPNHGDVVTIKWASNEPTTASNFWIVGVNDSPGGIATGKVMWGASASGIADTHADTDFDSWKVVDNDEDFYFIVRTE